MKKYIIKSLALVVLINFIAFSWDSMELASAKLYYKQKNYPKAIEFLKLEITKNPKSEDGWYYLALINFEIGNSYETKDAIDGYLKIGKKKSDDLNKMKLTLWAKAFNKGVESLNNATNDEELKISVSYFDTTCYVMPESTINFRNRALVYYRLGDYVKAEPDLILGSNNYTDNLSVKLLGDMYLEQAGNSKNKFNDINQTIFENIKKIESVKEKSKKEDVKYYLGEPEKIVKVKGKKKIEEWYYNSLNIMFTIEENVVSKIKNDFKPIIDSSSYFSAIGYYDNAINVLKIGMENFPNDPKISESLMNSYIGAEKNEEARALLTDRIKKYPDSKFDFYNLGVFLLKENKFEEAIDAFKSTLNIDPSMSAAQYNLAASYVNWGVFEQERLKKAEKESDKSYLEKYKFALPYLVKILNEKPDDVQMWDLLGQVYANLGEMKKAEEAYNKADSIRAGKK